MSESKLPLSDNTTHDLKVWPEYWRDLESGAKNFEVRIDDRGFKVGDTLLLRAWDPILGQYLGDEMRRRVKFILHGGQFGLPEGLCVLALDTVQSKGAYTLTERDALADELHKKAVATGEGYCPPSWSGHWRDWYRLRADEILASRTEQALPSAYEPCGVTDEGEPNLPCVLIKDHNHDDDSMHVDRFGGRWCE